MTRILVEFNRTPYELTLWQNLEKFIVKISYKVEKPHSGAKTPHFGGLLGALRPLKRGPMIFPDPNISGIE